MNARVRQTGALHNAASIQQQKFPVAGKIRPGIKVPTPSANKIAALKKAYADGLAAGATYDDITKAMKKASEKCPAYPLMPKNAPYFRVHPSDFTTPGAAQEIMDRYAEKRPGDTEPHLYSFPVVFPSNDIDLIFREQFEAWKQSAILHWSENDPDTGDLMCMRRQELKPDKNRRKQWGGRPTEVVGPCRPNNCDLFGEGHCKHMGSLYFWVPGVTGVGVIELEFSSIYASMGVMEILELVTAGLGRVNGMLGGKPIFTISKRGQNISVMDWQTGKAKRQGQQIIRLEASGLDMTEVLAAQESPMLAAPEQVARIGVDNQVESEPEKVDTETGEVIDGAVEPIEAAAEPEQKTEPEPEPESKAKAEPKPKAKTEEPDPLVAPLRKELAALSKQLQWSADDLKEWVVGNYDNESAAHDSQKLADMIGKLKALPELSNNGEAPF